MWCYDASLLLLTYYIPPPYECKVEFNALAFLTPTPSYQCEVSPDNLITNKLYSPGRGGGVAESLQGTTIKCEIVPSSSVDRTDRTPQSLPDSYRFYRIEMWGRGVRVSHSIIARCGGTAFVNTEIQINSN